MMKSTFFSQVFWAAFAKREAVQTEPQAKTIAYWVTTSVLAFCMTGGIFQLLGVQATVEGIVRLGYPSYIIPALGLAKVLALFAILWPGLPRLKEWAYAGIFFNMLGASVSHIATNEPWFSSVTLAIAGLTLASWALRPASRKFRARPQASADRDAPQRSG